MRQKNLGRHVGMFFDFSIRSMIGLHGRPKPKMQACGHLWGNAPKAQHMAEWAWGRVPASVLAAHRNPELTPCQAE